MKRRQLLLTLFGVPVVGSLIYAAIAKSKFQYEPVSAESPVSSPSPNPEIKSSNSDSKANSEILETAEEPLLRFAAIADNGFGSPDQFAVAKSMWETYQQKPYAFVLMAGDNIYSYGEISLAKARFEDPYAPLLSKDVKFYAVLGNHDIVKSNNGLDQINYQPFNMSDRYYSFTKGDINEGMVEFFALDTNGNAPWDAQLAWLDQQLAQSTAPWKIVYGHHPLYSSGRHGSNPELTAKLAPIFAKHKVPLYLCGHDHGYERSIPLDGTIYIVNGGGGAPLYKFG
ncbi:MULTISPECIES: metallophosphoesterase [Pseudanabaena]|jgi:predicted phosphodiesterase|uniref:metallophosphoesterase n=1 Tax=Pseudanabaena TaxID=1152 RepID=UPI00247AC151|nr:MULTISPECIES: metallophosphoesterase [Pseudanabaena]MEA5486870.1 metallophosphoesterase [Pseudanabaena sp. CCNP1317]WGS73931.1 metallophosphoesterase [Pseudanabaena galeata CCNP1313]